jgi:hypothetical protein
VDTAVKERTEVGVYDRNRRYDVEKGTKFADVVRDVEPGGDRIAASVDALKDAQRAFYAEHGPIDWWRADFTVSHTTAQVVVELRERP